MIQYNVNEGIVTILKAQFEAHSIQKGNFLTLTVLLSFPILQSQGRNYKLEHRIIVLQLMVYMFSLSCDLLSCDLLSCDLLSCDLLLSTGDIVEMREAEISGLSRSLDHLTQLLTSNLESLRSEQRKQSAGGQLRLDALTDHCTLAMVGHVIDFACVQFNSV